MLLNSSFLPLHLHFVLEAHAQWTIPPASFETNRSLYFYKGSDISIAGISINPYHSVELLADQPIFIENGENESSLLLLQGVLLMNRWFSRALLSCTRLQKYNMLLTISGLPNLVAGHGQGTTMFTRQIKVDLQNMIVEKRMSGKVFSEWVTNRYANGIITNRNYSNKSKKNR